MSAIREEKISWEKFHQKRFSWLIHIFPKSETHTAASKLRSYKTFIARRRWYESEYRMMMRVDQSQAL